jgi:hypothetical protein
MKGDFSRWIFNARRHYSAILMQQGRVQTDADWNAEQAIRQYHIETEASDVIGPSGAPEAEAGFGIGLTCLKTDLTISPGRMYVDGILCELEPPTPIDATSIAANQVRVATWVADDEPFAVGQWVEFSQEPQQSHFPTHWRITEVTEVDEGHLHLTLDQPVPDGVSVLRRVTTYTTQPDFPEPRYAIPSEPHGLPELDLADGIYLVYLDVWKRHITALEDSLIQESALGGPDTTTRLKTIWQVKLKELASAGDASSQQTASCWDELPEWQEVTQSTTGTLRARTACDIMLEDPPPQAGCRGLGNQLYRVEIHLGLPSTSPSFKWSRDNGIVVTSIEKISGMEITVHDLGRDELLRFEKGQWVEIVDDRLELQGHRGKFYQIGEVDPDTRIITLKDTNSEQSPRDLVDGIDLARHPKLRRWDGDAKLLPSNRDEWETIDDVIEIQFSEGDYRSGDYWLIPARAATGRIEWPRDETPSNNAIPQPPLGIHHHYCRLALVEVSDGIISVIDDCRNVFPSATGDIRVRRVLVGGFSDPDEEIELLDGMRLQSNVLAKGLRVQLNRAIDPTTANPAACFVTLRMPFEHRGACVGHQPLILGANVYPDGRSGLRWYPDDNARKLLTQRLTELITPFSMRWEVCDPEDGPQSDWGYGEGNSVEQTSADVGAGDRHEFGIGTVCTSRQRLKERAQSIRVHVTTPPHLLNEPMDVGVIFNWSSKDDYWMLVCKYWGDIHSSQWGQREHVLVDLGVTRVLNGELTFLHVDSWRPQGGEPEVTPTTGQISFTVQEEAATYLLCRTHVRFGHSFHWTKDYRRAGVLFENQGIGMVTRFNDGADFNWMEVRYAGDRTIFIPPALDSARVQGHLSIKRNLLRGATCSSGRMAGGPDRVHSQSQADFERWFWLEPSEGVYPYGYGHTGIGGDLI